MNKSYETFKKLSLETLQKRQQNIRTLKLRYPTRIPTIVYTKNNAIPITEKSKFLVEDKVTVAEFIHVLRKYVKLQQQESIFLFTEDNTIPASSSLLSNVYREHKNEDGFLYIEYNIENTFG